ncbi:Gp37-like protein [Pseudarthrobacter sp. alpha12b]
MSAFRIAVYDKDFRFRCQIGNPAALTATVRHNLTSTLTMSVPLTHRRFNELKEDGARLKVSFKGEHLISGPITADNIETDGVKGLYTVTVEDDLRVLWEILGWPVPVADITDQSGAEYRTYTGNAESIVKAAVEENGVFRLAVPGLTVAPNLNRGATIPGGVPLRMHPLADQLFPAVEEAGLGVSVKHVGAGLVLDVYEPTTKSRLSVKGRTLKKVSMNRTRPTASRVIIGGQGEGTARNFRLLTDAGREAQYGMRAEAFRDARDDNDPAVMDARGQETLTERGPKNGVSITLAEAGIFQYGPGGFHVGDRVPVKVTDDITITEVIRECKLTWTSKDYATSEPVIGEITDQPERITAQRLAALGRGQRNQETR